MREIARRRRREIRNSTSRIHRCDNITSVPDLLAKLSASADPVLSLNIVRELIIADASLVADIGGINVLVNTAAAAASNHTELLDACLGVLATIARLCAQHRDNVIFSMGGLEKVVEVFLLTGNIGFFGAIGTGTPPPPYAIYGPTVIDALRGDTRPVFEILKNMCDPQYGYAGRDHVCGRLEALLDRPVRQDNTDDVLQIIDNLSISDDPAHVAVVTQRRAFLEVLVYYAQIDEVRDDVFRIAANIATASLADLRIMKQLLLQPARGVIGADIDPAMKTEAILFVILCISAERTQTDITDACAMLRDVGQNSAMIQAEIFCCVAGIACDPTMRPMVRMEIESKMLLDRITAATTSTDTVINTTARHCLCALTTYEI